MGLSQNSVTRPAKVRQGLRFEQNASTLALPYPKMLVPYPYPKMLVPYPYPKMLVPYPYPNPNPITLTSP